MMWHRRKAVAEQTAAIEKSVERQRRIESNWDFIREQVRQGQRHRETNQIMELIIGVTRGAR